MLFPCTRCRRSRNCSLLLRRRGVTTAPPRVSRVTTPHALHVVVRTTRAHTLTLRAPCSLPRTAAAAAAAAAAATAVTASPVQIHCVRAGYRVQCTSVPSLMLLYSRMRPGGNTHATGIPSAAFCGSSLRRAFSAAASSLDSVKSILFLPNDPSPRCASAILHRCSQPKPHRCTL